jgi:gas vesicle protein
MAYLGNSSSRTTTAPGLPLGGRRAAQDPPTDAGLTRRWEPPFDTERVGTFGAGLALGLTLGAGLALLLAPRSGVETRAVLRRSARRAGARSRSAWDDLREELEYAARRGRRRVRRAVQRGGWAAEDLVDDRVRRRKHSARTDDDC